MLAIERRSEILSLLQRDGRVLVAELSKIYNVTEETIRRDLEKLEKEGLVKKTYGGAVLRENTGLDMPFSVRSRSNIEEKAAIAQKVAELVEDGDSVMLDSSSTAHAVAKALTARRKLTVITNSVEILVDLAGCSGITLISTGGQLRESALSLVGRVAERTLENYYVDKTILSCKGLDLERGVTESNELEVDLKKAMIRSGRKIILAADSSKFNRVSFTKLMETKDIHTLVTDKSPGESWMEALKAINVELL